MLHYLSPDWYELLKSELDKPYFQKLTSLVAESYKNQVVYPSREQVFHALNLCPFSQLKVVIIGQDPYHGPGQAHGLSFSVSDGVKQPPSLKNIFKELESDIPGFHSPPGGNLERWARQGVLLLNAILTVNEGSPGSHKAFGWETFTDAIIHLVNEKKEHVVFLLWGNYAISKANLIDPDKHLVLNSAHPSPLARGAFFGNKHFSVTNKYLLSHGISPVDWRLDQAREM
jgi:uracil-DNA glycosylase